MMFKDIVQNYFKATNGFPVILVHGFISDGKTWIMQHLYDLPQSVYKSMLPMYAKREV